MGKEKIYFVGEKIGECTYLGKDFYNGRYRYAYFKCHCGNEFSTQIAKVKKMHTRSCGCLHKRQLIERNKKHGSAVRGYKPKEYNIWVLIKQRCYNPKTKGFKNWGGRGIQMCDRWLESYDNFIFDMGKCPPNCRGIDRINNDGNYEPTNCRWATQKQQMRNVRKNRIVKYNGEEKPLAQWEEELNISHSSFYYGLKKGFTETEILQKYKRNN